MRKIIILSVYSIYFILAFLIIPGCANVNESGRVAALEQQVKKLSDAQYKFEYFDSSRQLQQFILNNYQNRGHTLNTVAIDCSTLINVLNKFNEKTKGSIYVSIVDTRNGLDLVISNADGICHPKVIGVTPQPGPIPPGPGCCPPICVPPPIALLTSVPRAALDKNVNTPGRRF